MFQTGDKVVYPLHGVGTIEAIEEHQVLEEMHRYYVVKLMDSEMKVLVPTDDRAKIRGIIKEKEVEDVIGFLQQGILEKVDSDWKTRHNNNLEKMRSGCIFKVAEVVKSLASRHKQKGLSVGEKRLFDNAFNMMVSEIAFARNIGLDQASLIINKVLC